jgi:hypothetical protein
MWVLVLRSSLPTVFYPYDTWLLFRFLLRFWGECVSLFNSLNCCLLSCQFVCLIVKFGCFSWSSACALSVTKPGECSEDMSKRDFITAKAWGIHFVKQKSTRSGSLFLSVGHYFGSPVERCFRPFLSSGLSTSRPLAFVSLDPHSVCLAL